MKPIRSFFFLFLISAALRAQYDAEIKIETVLDNWHKAAANADFEAYFNLMTPDAVFVGTDATENWSNESFRRYAKPHFEKGRAWNFIPLERNVYVDRDSGIAWFDELLATQMGLCRGSGVLRKNVEDWKIAHYVLSIAVPNENVPALVKLKKKKDSLLLIQLQKDF